MPGVLHVDAANKTPHWVGKSYQNANVLSESQAQSMSMNSLQADCLSEINDLHFQNLARSRAKEAPFGNHFLHFAGLRDYAGLASFLAIRCPA